MSEKNIVEVWSREDLENMQPNTVYRIMAPIPADGPEIVVSGIERIELNMCPIGAGFPIPPGAIITTGERSEGEQ